MKRCKCYCGDCKPSQKIRVYEYIKKNGKSWIGKMMEDGMHPNRSIQALRELVEEGHLKMEYDKIPQGTRIIYSIRRSRYGSNNNRLVKD